MSSNDTLSYANGEMFKKHLLNSNILYNKISYNIYEVYSNDKFEIPILNGRTFNKEDFMSMNNKAIVGVDVPVETNGDGEKYYIYNSNKYKVIGTMGMKRNSWLDNSVYICWNENPLSSLSEAVILDGLEIQKNISVYQAQNKSFTVTTLESSGLSRIFKSNNTDFDTLFIAIEVAFLSAIISITCLWIIQKQKWLMILKLIGLSRVKLFAAISLEFLKNAIAFFICGIILSNLLFQKMFSIPFDLWSSLFVIFLGILCCIVPALIISLGWTGRSLGRYQR